MAVMAIQRCEKEAYAVGTDKLGQATHKAYKTADVGSIINRG